MYSIFSSKQRIPAWCDRILYKVQTDLEGLKAKKRKYDSPAYMKGDHKPVVASFDVNVCTVYIPSDVVNPFPLGDTF